MKHVLVSGASGLLGSATVQYLLAQGWRVTGLVRRPQPSTVTGLRVIPFDITKDELSNLPPDVTAVVHCAAFIPTNFNDPSAAKAMLDVNAWGTLRLLNWAKEVGVTRFVHCSSHSLYKRPVPLPIPEDHPVYPTSHASYYAVSKLAAEVYASSMNTASFVVCSLRFPSLYGADMKQYGVLPQFVSQALLAAPFDINTAPDSQFDFLFVDDAAQAISLCLENSISFTVYNIGSGRGVTLPELARACWQVFGPPTPPIIRYTSLHSETSHTVLDITRACNDIGYAPRYDLLAGLQAMKHRATTWPRSV